MKLWIATDITPTMCAFHSHPHHTNGVHVMISPIVCSAIHSMAHAIHLSPTQSHYHPCYPSQQTHTMWEVSSQQMPNTQTQPLWKPFSRCMHTRTRQRCTVCWVWLDCIVTSWNTMEHWHRASSNLLSKETVLTWVNKRWLSTRGRTRQWLTIVCHPHTNVLTQHINHSISEKKGKAVTHNKHKWLDFVAVLVWCWDTSNHTPTPLFATCVEW